MGGIDDGELMGVKVHSTHYYHFMRDGMHTPLIELLPRFCIRMR